MLITEIFHSIQGEGPLTGIPMLFIRTNRCNLRCRWCDTVYSFDGGKEYDLEDLIDLVKNSWERWVCLTGGEPLLQRDSQDLVEAVNHLGKGVLIETGGSLDIEPYTKFEHSVIDMDIKTPSSGETSKMKMDNLKLLRKEDYAKLVISNEEDFLFLEDIYRNWGDRINLIVQPAWGISNEWIVNRVIERKMNVRFMLQEHKYIWGEKRGV